MSCDGDQLEDRKFCLANESHECIKYVRTSGPSNGKMVSSSSLAVMSSENNPDENTQLCHVHHISRLVKLEEKALTSVSILP